MMDTVPKNYKRYIDRSHMLSGFRDAHFDGERFTPGEPYTENLSGAKPTTGSPASAGRS